MTCRHQERCGGCPLLALAPGEQSATKRESLARALARHPSLAALTVPDLVASEEPFGYRRRLKWMVDSGHLGMYARGGTHRVVDTPECLVAHPALLPVAETIRGHAAGLGLVAVDLRLADSPDGARVLATLVVSARDRSGRLAQFADELRRRHPEVVGVAENIRGRDNPQVLGTETRLVAGTAVVADRIDRAHVLATFGSFVQAHRGQARRITEAIAARVMGLSPRPRVLELYGGSGAFGLELAARGAEVQLVEAFAPAAELAAKAAAQQGLALSARAADATAFTVDAAASGERYDVVLVDPPRRGLSVELRRAIARLAPRLLVYVSCQPPTLARDLEHFEYLGLRAASVAGYDMIPQTEEVETLCFLEGAPPLELPLLLRSGGYAVFDAPAFLKPSEFTASARRVLGGSDVRVSLPRAGASGAVLVADGAVGSAAHEARALVLAKGLTTNRGDAHGLDYRRVALVGGHSLLDLGIRSTLDAELAALAKTGHPAIGGPGSDPATVRHFAEKHGLERPFVHVVTLVTPHGESVRSPLAGDLVAVLTSLGGAWPLDGG